MNSRLCLLLLLFLFIFSLSIDAIKPPNQRSLLQSLSGNLPSKSPLLSTVVIPLSGNVFPLGYYSVSLRIGNPPKAYTFDVDTGSDLTWVQCDAPCRGCTLPRPLQYKPKANTVPCSAPACSALNWPNKPHCPNPKEQCDYDVQYADHASSMGVLLTDQFHLTILNGTFLQPRLAFGCGYDQHFPSGHPPPPHTAGVLGLGRGKVGILTQLVATGLTRNVIGHCLSSKGGGFLFFGDSLVPSLGVAWTPLVSPDNHYTTGPADILFDGKPTGLKGLKLIFDTGSSYTYFNTKTYQTIVTLIGNELKGKPLKVVKEDKTLPICWKAAKPLKSLVEVKNLFKTLTINFSNGKRNTQLHIPPESYLIISKTGNACLGILNGSEIGLQTNNVIGDIFMQGIMMIYDNEKQQLGWVSANCDKLPKS